MVQLVEKQRIANNPHFEKWNHIKLENTVIEIFIDKNLKNELEHNSKVIKIDARTWKLFGKYRGSLSLEIEHI